LVNQRALRVTGGDVGGFKAFTAPCPSVSFRETKRFLIKEKKKQGSDIYFLLRDLGGEGYVP